MWLLHIYCKMIRKPWEQASEQSVGVEWMDTPTTVMTNRALAMLKTLLLTTLCIIKCHICSGNSLFTKYQN